MTIRLNKFLSQEHIQTFERVGMDKLQAGTNLRLNEKVYNVKVIETTFTNPQSNRTFEVLAIRVHTEQLLAFLVIQGTTRTTKKDPQIFIPDDTGVNETCPNLYELLNQGQQVVAEMGPKLQRALSPKENMDLEHYPALAPTLEEPEAPANAPQWSNKQKVFGVVCAALALTAVGYGIRKIRKGDISLPSKQDVSDFLSKWNPKNWQQNAPIKA